MAKRRGEKKNIPSCKKHNWRLVSWSITKLNFICTKCPEKTNRKPTKVEIRQIKKKSDEWHKRISEIHKLSREFHKKFRGESARTRYGYDLMEAVEKWSEKHPEVQITGCDDSYFMSSDLVLIPHQRKVGGKVVEYWGTTMVYLPQNNVGYTEIFLYPGHVDGLQEALKKMKGPKTPYGPPLKFKF